MFVTWMAICLLIPVCVLLIGGVDQAHNAEQADHNPHHHENQACAGAGAEADAARRDQKTEKRDRESHESHRFLLTSLPCWLRLRRIRPLRPPSNQLTRNKLRGC